MAGPFARTHVRTVERWSVKEGTVSARTRPVVMRGLEARLQRMLIARKGGRGLRPHYGLSFLRFVPAYDVVYMLKETTVVYDLSACQLHFWDPYVLQS